MSFVALIEQWPSLAEFAKDVGQKRDAVQKWKQRDSIPAAHWLTIVRAAEARGIDVSINDLAAIRQQSVA